MQFSDQITRSPIPYHPDRGNEIVRGFDNLPAPLADLVKGTAGCSPYLASIMHREANWLRTAFDDPDKKIADLFADIRQTPLDQLNKILRIAKARIAGITALADLGGIWPLEKVTQTLSDFADVAVDVTIKALLSAEIRRGKMPGKSEADIENACGMVVLAMGKGGAGELNYSSDIDLICLFDDSQFSPDDYQDARASFIRVTRRMCALLSDITGDGYVFRTDLRLRHDPSVTPVCVAMRAAEQYYESLGRTWERAAHIKARVCAGDFNAGNAYLKRLEPFIWRKHLDFAAIQDAHDMRLRIREHKGLGGPICLEGHNMKLGRGGIREIEFFTQTRQIIAGGRDPSLRSSKTVVALRALATKGWVEPEIADILITRYREHREVEHRLQMINDAQTHDLPKTADEFDRLARFIGEGETPNLRKSLHTALAQVHELTEGFFAPEDEQPETDLPDGGDDIIARWQAYPALRSSRAVAIFERLRPAILERINKTANPIESLLQFDKFLSGLPAGVQLFSLFEANPQLIDLIVDICGTSSDLAQYLARNSQVLDAVLGGAFFSDWPDQDGLKSDLDAVLARAQDYETRLDSARRWMKEWHFRIGVHHLRGLVDAQTAGRQYAELAQTIVAGVWPLVVDMFREKHGVPPGNGAVILAMGSLGAGRLNARSDLDLIVIYDADGVDSSDGKRPLSTRLYYARLTQAMVTALSAPMAEGRLYEVDMRLRPSGRQGPVATSVQAFEAYQMDEAWTWEHLALTRARLIAGPKDLQSRVEKIRRAVLLGKCKGGKIIRDVIEMRTRLLEAKPALHMWEAKLGQGRMQDIELLAQTAALLSACPKTAVSDHIKAGQAANWLTKSQANTLQAAYDFFWSLQSVTKLLSDTPLEMTGLGERGCDFVLRETGAKDATDLERDMTFHATAVQKLVEARLKA